MKSVCNWLIGSIQGNNEQHVYLHIEQRLFSFFCYFVFLRRLFFHLILCFRFLRKWKTILGYRRWRLTLHNFLRSYVTGKQENLRVFDKRNVRDILLLTCLFLSAYVCHNFILDFDGIQSRIDIKWKVLLNKNALRTYAEKVRCVKC